MLALVQVPAFANSTMTEYPAVDPHPSPTAHTVPPIVTLAAVPFFNAVAKIGTFVASVTVMDAPFELVHEKALYEPVN